MTSRMARNPIRTLDGGIPAGPDCAGAKGISVYAGDPLAVWRLDDHAAQKLSSFYCACREDVLRYVQSILSRQHQDLAEDIVQEAFLSVLKNTQRLQELTDAEIKRYFISIVRHRAIDAIRKKGRKPICIQLDAPDATRVYYACEPDPLEQFIEKEQRFFIFAAIRKLNPIYRDILVLKYIFEVPNKEVAEILQISPARVANYYHSAKIALSRVLRDFAHQREGSAKENKGVL